MCISTDTRVQRVQAYGPGCSDFQSGDFAITIQQGDNLVWSSISDNYGSYYDEAHYYGGSPPPPPPPPPPPTVTPNGQVSAIPPGNGYHQVFQVLSNLGDNGNYTTSVVCGGVVSGCSVNPTSYYSLALVPKTNVDVSFNVSGLLNQTGTVTMRATNVESGVYGEGIVTVKIAPGGPIVERGGCLTIAAGANAAYECGDVRLVHPLPSVRTLNKSRVPVLVYNTQHARPYPLFQADITAPSPLPQTIRTIVRIGGVVRAQRDLPGTTWGSSGRVRRVVLGFRFATATGV